MMHTRAEKKLGGIPRADDFELVNTRRMKAILHQMMNRKTRFFTSLNRKIRILEPIGPV